MLNFKQYLLKENSITPGSASLIVTLFFNDNVTAGMFNSLESRIGNSAKDFQLDFSSSDSEIYIDVLNLNAQNGNHNSLKILFELMKSEAKDIAKHYNNYFSVGESILACRGFPPFKLEWSEININMLPDQKITGIDKFIDLNETCIFINCHNIIGGVLSLLKIKHGRLYLNFHGVQRPKWVDIVNKHLKDKNLIDCQKELYDNDLDEYAEL